MRVFQIEGDWGFEHLRLATRPDPAPGPGQVLLRMKAASLNFRDLVVPERGYGQYTGTLPLIPVSDGVGEVVAVGAGVERVAVGDRVCPMFMQRWIGGTLDLERITGSLGGPIDGTMADFMVLSQAVPLNGTPGTMTASYGFLASAAAKYLAGLVMTQPLSNSTSPNARKATFQQHTCMEQG